MLCDTITGDAMAANDPVSEVLLVRLLDDVAERVDGGHGRVRVSINEMRLDMRLGFEKLEARMSQQDTRANAHGEDIEVIKAERAVEAENAKTRKQDQRDRTVLLTTLVSMGVTVALFTLKALLHL